MIDRGNAEIGVELQPTSPIQDAAINSETETESRISKAAGMFFDEQTTKIEDERYPDEEQAIRERNRNLFIKQTEKLFGNIFEITQQQEQEIEPILRELYSVLASIRHNENVYYTEVDTPAIFQALSTHLFTDKGFVSRITALVQNQELVERSAADKAFLSSIGMDSSPINPRPNQIHKLVQDRVQQVSSLTDERAIGMTKNEAGEWSVIAEDRLLGNENSIEHVVEWMRQDNADKGGANKYRVRETQYVKKADDIHKMGFSEGWYKSHWYDEPNYWSQQLRQLIINTSKRVNTGIDQNTSSIVFVSEGGVFKGTSTVGTDVDTYCYVLCDSPEDFENIYQRIDSTFALQRQALPFRTKKDEKLRPVFFNRKDGQTYYRDERTGAYNVVTLESLMIGDPVPFDIRSNEQGVFVVGENLNRVYPKPNDLQGRPMRVGISSKDLNIASLPDVVPPKPSSDGRLKVYLS